MAYANVRVTFEADTDKLRETLESMARAFTQPLSDLPGQACTICGDDEPVHVHDDGKRIDDYFTVGRGETDFQAAERWKRRALKAEGAN